MIPIIPRLNYKYTLKDGFTSIGGLFSSEIDNSEITNYFGVNNISFVNHARTGIRIALTALNLPKGSSIGVQAFNCQTVFNAISSAGFKLVFIDVTSSFQIDIEDLKRKKNQIDGLLLTHLFGIPADLDKVKEVLSDLPLIEDCAHSFLSKYNDRYTGTFGDIGVFSIGKAKFPSIGAGGFIFVNNLKYLERASKEIELLTKESLIDEIFSVIFGCILSVLHNPFIYGIFTLPFLKNADKKKDISGNWKFTERKILKVNQYLFLRKFNKYLYKSEKQAKNAALLIKSINNNLVLNQVLDRKVYKLNYFMLPLLIDNGRDNIIEAYLESGIEIGAHFKKAIECAMKYGYNANSCLESEKIVNKIITIPCHYNLSQKELLAIRDLNRKNL